SAFGFVAAHLFIERVQKLLARGRAGERGAMIQRAPEPPVIQQSFGRAVEHDAHAIEQVDDAGRSFAHALDERLVGQKIAAINGVVEVLGDTTDKHFDDTIYGGDFLANQPLVKRMCEAAPSIIDLLDRMGVMFNRTPEGLLDYRRFGGTLYHRTAFAGATTGQQLLYALDEQVRRHEAEGRVKKFEGATFLSAVLDGGGVCRGICAMDLRTMEVKTFAADAVIFATGGNGTIFGRSTNSVVCTGSAQAALFQQGVDYANGEFIQVHP